MVLLPSVSRCCYLNQIRVNAIDEYVTKCNNLKLIADLLSQSKHLLCIFKTSIMDILTIYI